MSPEVGKTIWPSCIESETIGTTSGRILIEKAKEYLRQN